MPFSEHCQPMRYNLLPSHMRMICLTYMMHCFPRQSELVRAIKGTHLQVPRWEHFQAASLSRLNVPSDLLP